MKNQNTNKIIAERLVDLKIDIGLQILELRLLKNYTQKQLASIIGTQQPSVARIERGATIPTLGFLNKIATALGTDLIPPKFSLVEENEIKYQAKTTYKETITPSISISVTGLETRTSIRPSWLGITSQKSVVLALN